MFSFFENPVPQEVYLTMTCLGHYRLRLTLGLHFHKVLDSGLVILLSHI